MSSGSERGFQSGQAVVDEYMSIRYVRWFGGADAIGSKASCRNIKLLLPSCAVLTPPLYYKYAGVMNRLDTEDRQSTYNPYMDRPSPAQYQ